MSACGFTDHFAQVAGQYASYRPTYPPALFEWLAQAVPAHELMKRMVAVSIKQMLSICLPARPPWPLAVVFIKRVPGLAACLP